MATLDVYWRQCLHSSSGSGGEGEGGFCQISTADYQLAWAAVTAAAGAGVGGGGAEVEAFCRDECLTQTIVLDAPTSSNLRDLKNMCRELDIGGMPFVDAMVFAGVVERNGSELVVLGDDAGGGGGGVESKAASGGWPGDMGKLVVVAGLLVLGGGLDLGSGLLD